MVRRVCGWIGGVGAVLFLLAVALADATILVRLWTREGVAGLGHPATAHILAELWLVALLFAGGLGNVGWNSARGGRVLAAVVAGVAAIASLRLIDRAPWWWWTAALAFLAAMGTGPWMVKWAARRTAIRVLTWLMMPVWLFAAGQGVVVGAGFVWYPIPLPAPERTEDRDEGWRQDLVALRDNLLLLHIDAAHAQPRDVFERRVAELIERVADLDDRQLTLEMSALVASIGDAHTSLSMGAVFNEPRLPVVVRWFEDEQLRIWAADDSAKSLLGARVLAIDGVGLDELKIRLRRVLSHEHESWLEQVSSSRIGSASFLHTLGVLEHQDRARFSIEDEDGQREVEVLAAPLESLSFTAIERPKRAAYEQRRGESAWWAADPKYSLVYFRYASCEITTSLSSIANEAFAQWDRYPFWRFVIDLRDNGGGSELPFLAFVLSQLQARPDLDEDRLFVLIDSGTFSSGVGLSRALETVTSATLVGVPTGGETNGYGEVRSFVLPNSGLSVRYSTRGPNPDLPRGPVSPEVEIELTWEDFAAGRDPALRWVLDQPINAP